MDHGPRLSANEHEHHGPAQKAETRTRIVVVLTAVTMVAELIVGWVTGSLALFADGAHMGTHVGALTIAAFAYWYARTRSGAADYTFGTGKVYALAGYTSSLGLAIAALWMFGEGIARFFHPEQIAFGDALP